MNVSYILKSNIATERHMLEHVVLYRTKNYPEDTSFYTHLFDLGVEQSFQSWYEYMEITFYNVTDNIIKEIDLEMSSWYFTKEDLELEKRVILIEASNYDHNKVELDIQNLFVTNKYQSVCDIKELQDMTFEKLLEIKNKSTFEKVIFNKREALNINQEEDNVDKDITIKNLVNKNYILKNNFIILDKKTLILDGVEFISFNIKHDVSLYDLSILLAWFFDSSNYFYSRLLTLYENTLVFKKLELELFKNNFESILNDKYDEIYSKAFSDGSNVSNSVNYKLKNFINIDDVYTKEQIKNMLVGMVKSLEI